MVEVVLSDVSRVHADGTRAISHLDLAVADGELLVLMGPSGSGKTTTLRVVAGLEPVSEGVITIDGRVVNQLRPGERDVAMITQEHGLYPHLDVFDNLGFALRMRGLPAAEIEQRVRAEARVLGLSRLLRRRPRTLSAGARQKVALGRATTRVPRLFEMDEPLTNLDAAQRHRMRDEIAQLQRGLGVTMLYATNDQAEAMVLGDRVAVLCDGALEQVGPPQQLYDRPGNLRVATTVGSPPMNVLSGRLDYGPAASWLWMGQLPLALGGHLPPLLRRYDGRAVAVGVRPEHVRQAAPSDANPVGVRVRRLERLGSATLAFCALEPSDEHLPLVARLSPAADLRVGEHIQVAVDPRRLHFFDVDSRDAVWHGDT